jgi:hypothetical protein
MTSSEFVIMQPRASKSGETKIKATEKLTS